MKKFLIIGTGRRVKANILPALVYLGKQVKVIGMCGRTNKTVRLPGGGVIKAETNLRKVDYSKVDVIVISVTTESVPQVLTTLESLDVHGKTFFIDTPVVRLNSLRVLKG
jgi:prephenate dehydrogenase